MTQKSYIDSNFTSRTGAKNSYISLHATLLAASVDVKSIYQDGDGCDIVLNSDLSDWSAVDTIIGDHVGE